MFWKERKNSLLGMFFLVVIGVAVGYGVLMDPFSGAIIAAGSIILLLTVFSPWYIVALLLALTPFQILWAPGGISLVEVLYSSIFLLLITCWTARYITNIFINENVIDIKSPLLLPLILLFAAALFSAFIAITKGRPFEAWGSHLNLISYYALYFVVVGYLRSLKDLKRIFILFFIFTTIGVTKGILYHLTIGSPNTYLFGSVVPKIARASSAGLVMFMMTMPFAIIVKKKKTKIFFSLATLFFGVLQVMSFVRSRWLGAIAGIIFLFLVLSPVKKMRFIKYSLILLLITIIYIYVCSAFPFNNKLFFKLPHIVGERFATILRPSEEVTVLTRFSEWNAAMEKIRRHPIVGNGLGTQVSYIGYDAMRKPTGVTRSIHNSYLFYYLNTGILGLFAILWLSIAFIFYGLRIFRTTKEDYYKAFVLGCVTAFVAISVASLAGAGLNLPSRTIVIGFLMGAVTLIDKLKR